MICVSSSISGWERLEGYECEYDEEHVWTDETCTYQVLVHAGWQGQLQFDQPNQAE